MFIISVNTSFCLFLNIIHLLTSYSLFQVASRSLPHQVTPLIALDLSLQSQNQNEPRNILLQTDTTNLSHITTKLKAALAESRTSYSRKLQNTFLETSK